VHLVPSGDKQGSMKFARLKQGSVETIVGTSPEDWNTVKNLLSPTIEPIGSLVYCVGLHPWKVARYADTKWLQTLENLLLNHSELQVGEIGLDKAWVPPEGLQQEANFHLQLKVFKKQLELAGKLERSASVHCVKAHSALMETLSSIKLDLFPNSIYMHSWSGSADITRQLVKKKFGQKIYFGVSAHVNLRGLIARDWDGKTAGELIASQLWRRKEKLWSKFCGRLNEIPLNKLLLESDLAGFESSLAKRKDSLCLITAVVADALRLTFDQTTTLCLSNLKVFHRHKAIDR